MFHCKKCAEKFGCAETLVKQDSLARCDQCGNVIVCTVVPSESSPPPTCKDGDTHHDAYPCQHAAQQEREAALRAENERLWEAVQLMEEQRIIAHRLYVSAECLRQVITTTDDGGGEFLFLCEGKCQIEALDEEIEAFEGIVPKVRESQAALNAAVVSGGESEAPLGAEIYPKAQQFIDEAVVRGDKYLYWDDTVPCPVAQEYGNPNDPDYVAEIGSTKALMTVGRAIAQEERYEKRARQIQQNWKNQGAKYIHAIPEGKNKNDDSGKTRLVIDAPCDLCVEIDDPAALSAIIESLRRGHEYPEVPEEES